MTSTTTANATENYDLETKRFGMWIFIATETVFFGGAIFLYSGERHFYPEAFSLASKHLALGIAAINTAILLTSSFTMAIAVKLLEAGRKRACGISLGLTALFGVGFLALKGYEYVLDAGHGTLVGFSYHPDFSAPKEVVLFFSLYLLMTAMHAVHLTVGVFWCLGISVAMIRSPKPANELRARVDVLGLYWHFVDVVWIFLLPLFYLIGSGS